MCVYACLCVCVCRQTACLCVGLFLSAAPLREAVVVVQMWWRSAGRRGPFDAAQGMRHRECGHSTALSAAPDGSQPGSDLI